MGTAPIEGSITERTPAEVEGIGRLNREFVAAIAETEGVDRQIVLDALEYTMWNLLAECFDSPRDLEAYLAVMRDRCLGVWRRQNDVGGAAE